MANVEVLNQKDGFVVQATFREPFEHFFEIAQHRGIFQNVRDANRLAARVKAAFKEIGLSKSLSFALSTEEWNYVSSASDTRYHRRVETYVVPASKSALAADANYD